VKRKEDDGEEAKHDEGDRTPGYSPDCRVGCSGQQAAPARPDSDLESFRISVDVALVVLHATVTDRQGGFCLQFGEQDF